MRPALSLRPFALLLGTLLMSPLLSGCGETSPDSDAGFAGLGDTTEGYRQARAGTPLRFPADHGAHPHTRIEWWYLTANLEDKHGEPMGLQWTLFRQALSPPDDALSTEATSTETTSTEAPSTNTPPGKPSAPNPWVADQLWMAHLAVSRGEQHAVAERFARSHSQAPSQRTDAQAGAVAQPFRAWLDDWELASNVSDPEADTFKRLNLTAFDGKGDKRFGYRLELTAEGPLVLHGNAGFSQKSADGQGSYYYSQPFWHIEGEVVLAGKTHEVSGRGWLDREWSSQLLSPAQTGWDWFSLHLDDGHRLMAFQLHGGGSDGGDYRSGSWITPDGAVTALDTQALELSPLTTALVAGHEVPIRWHLAVPGQGLELIVEAPHTNRWMDTTVPYWEGGVIARDPQSDERLGIGYLEMTGY